MECFKFYEVGGKIRDELLGLKSKDVDYVAVPCESLLADGYTAERMFEILQLQLELHKFDIFLVTEDCYTIRAKFPTKCENCSGKSKKGLCIEHNCQDYSDKWKNYSGTADFVMARKEVGYILGTRTPIVEPGNLYDDLSRRDFTVNAMAKDPDTGELIDYFGGMEDLKNRVLRTPLNVEKTLSDDPLRILRAIRFSITKDFLFTSELDAGITFFPYHTKMKVVSEERIREELVKCFKHNTLYTIEKLEQYDSLKLYIFKNTKLWLKPTTEQ